MIAPTLALSALRPRRDHRAGNALIVAIMFITLFAIKTGPGLLLTSEKQRHAARESKFTTIQTAGDAAMDVLYGRFTHWTDANTGRTPSITDAGTAGIPTNASFPAINSAIDFSGTSVTASPATLPGLTGYTVSGISVVPVQGDDTPDSAGIKNAAGANPPVFPSASTFHSNPTGYQTGVKAYYVNVPNLYEPATMQNGLVYQAKLTVTPTTGTGSLQTNPLTVTRYFQKSEVTPFNYNVFSVGSFEAREIGQSFDSEANVYSSVDIKLDHKGTYVNGVMRYGRNFIDPDGNIGGTSDLKFVSPTDPTFTQFVDPYTSGLLKQVATKIEVVPDIADALAKDSNGNRIASTEFTTAADNFSRRELIEPPANLGVANGDTAPQTIQDRRIFTQADTRLKVSVGATTSTTIGGTTYNYTLATGTFYNADGSKLATYTGYVTSPTVTTWVAGSGATAATSATINAVTINTVNSSAPFNDKPRAADSATSGTAQGGQPTSSNFGHAIESVDVNVGTLDTAIAANPYSAANGGSYAQNIVYIWDDGTSGEKNGVRLYNGGVLPTAGLTVGSTNPVYVKGDYNTGTVLPPDGGTAAVPITDINAGVASVQPIADTVGWNGGTFASVSDRTLPSYTLKPAGIFGDTITTLSQAWKDASSTGTQNASSTTYNAVLGFGSGNANELLSDDTFVNGSYANTLVLESWSNTRWNQLGEQMTLYHSIYNMHKTGMTFAGGWQVIQNDFDFGTAHVPLKWGYLVFSRGRYTQN